MQFLRVFGVSTYFFEHCIFVFFCSSSFRVRSISCESFLILDIQVLFDLPAGLLIEVNASCKAFLSGASGGRQSM